MSTKVKSGTSEGGNQGEGGEGAGGNAGAGDAGANNPGSSNQGGEGSGEGGGTGAPDESKWSPETAAYIKKLRAEAADGRTKAKDLASKLSAQAEKEKKLKAALGIADEDQTDPEEKLKASEAEKQTLQFRLAIMEAGVAGGVSGEEMEYFEFLVQKRASELKEGEELTDEMMTELVTKVKGKSKGKANTTTTGGGANNGGGDPNAGAGEITLEKFVKMNMSEKSRLYAKDKATYERLLAEAKQNNRLI